MGKHNRNNRRINLRFNRDNSTTHEHICINIKHPQYATNFLQFRHHTNNEQQQQTKQTPRTAALRAPSWRRSKKKKLAVKIEEPHARLSDDKVISRIPLPSSEPAPPPAPIKNRDREQPCAVLPACCLCRACCRACMCEFECVLLRANRKVSACQLQNIYVLNISLASSSTTSSSTHIVIIRIARESRHQLSFSEFFVCVRCVLPKKNPRAECVYSI